ncbi:MAG: LPS export ABC transporter periplasmic protein LptC [Rhodobacter sp.]|nr:LPS export ABC transporter periplasmic protein LptC [Rhodobacter sp.]
MVRTDDTYSRVIAWLKILLPLVALGILSILFLVARTIDPAQDLPFADVDIDEITRDQRVSRPNFSSVTADGAAITLSASTARPVPGSPDIITGDNIAAAIDLAGGSRIDIRADAAVIDSIAQLAELQGGVVLHSSEGITLKTDALSVSLETSQLASDSAIALTGPHGRLTAGSFRTQGDGSDGNPYVVVFKDRVELIYDPEQ